MRYCYKISATGLLAENEERFDSRGRVFTGNGYDYKKTSWRGGGGYVPLSKLGTSNGHGSWCVCMFVSVCVHICIVPSCLEVRGQPLMPVIFLPTLLETETLITAVYDKLASP